MSRFLIQVFTYIARALISWEYGGKEIGFHSEKPYGVTFDLMKRFGFDEGFRIGKEDSIHLGLNHTHEEEYFSRVKDDLFKFSFILWWISVFR